MEDDKQKHFMCSCGCGILHLSTDEDFIYLAIYQHMGYRNKSWRYKLRQIWKILKTGEPYADEFVLDSKNAKKMVKFIESVI